MVEHNGVRNHCALSSCSRSGKFSPKSVARLCTGCRSLPENWDTFMHGVQKSASNPGHVYAWGAEVCPKPRACLCMGCRSLPEIRGMFLPRVHKSAPNLRLINELAKWFALNLGHIIPRSENLPLDSVQINAG